MLVDGLRFVLGAVTSDLGVFLRELCEVSVGEALIWTAGCISLSLVFNLGVYFWFGCKRTIVL
jgi:tellurite resistance protein TerC